MYYFSRAYIKYTQELSKEKYNPLSRDKELLLLNELSSGSVIAKNAIIESHLRFVVYLLNDFKIPLQIDRMDLIQEGNLGLLDGLSKFSSFQNCRISTYVQYYIKWYVSRSLGYYSKTLEVEQSYNDCEFDNLKNYLKDDPIIKEEVHQDIYKYIKSFLSKREAKVIGLLFGLETPFKSFTLKEIGSMIHLNPETVRLAGKSALEKIRLNQKNINLLR